MTAKVKVGRRGQMTLPRAVRSWLAIEEGDHVAFIRSGDEVVVRGLSRTLLDLRGAVPVDGPQDFDAVRQTVAARRAVEVARRDG